MTASSLVQSLAQKHFLYVTGKGGVGKSTISAVLALWAAALGRRTLLVTQASSHDPISIFGSRLTAKPTPIAASLDAVAINAQAAMLEYSSQVLRSRKLAESLLHPRVAGGFLSGIPGLSEWAILGNAWAYCGSGTFEFSTNQSRYDLVILDAPASGDGTKMLGVPEVILKLAPGGRLRSDAASCAAMLADPARSAVILVTLAEELPLTETEENLTLIRDQMHLPLGPLFVNRLLPRLFNEEEKQQIQAANERLLAISSASAIPSSPVIPHPTSDISNEDLNTVASLLRSAEHRAKREESQQIHLRQLEGWAMDIVQVPEINQQLSGLPALTQLQKVLAEQD